MPDDIPVAAWTALRPGTTPEDVELLGPQVWRVGREVLKRFPDADLAQFRRIVRAHRQAGRIFKGQARLAAQRLLTSDEDQRALLLDFVPGRSGRMVLLDGVDPEFVLARAGAWLHHLHGGREVVPGQFDPRAALDRLEATPDCAEPEAYRDARLALALAGEGLAGRTLRRAVLHGDLTLANLLFEGEVVTGIDFENLSLHPAARDIGEVWADLLLHLLRMPEAPGLMPRAWAGAFRAQYPALEREIVAFYTRHRLLRVWAAIPAGAQDRGPGRERQLANLRDLVARGAFGAAG